MNTIKPPRSTNLGGFLCGKSKMGGHIPGLLQFSCNKMPQSIDYYSEPWFTAGICQ